MIALREPRAVTLCRWNEALQINDKDAALLEMKAQALIQVERIS